MKQFQRVLKSLYLFCMKNYFQINLEWKVHQYDGVIEHFHTNCINIYNVHLELIIYWTRVHMHKDFHPPTHQPAVLSYLLFLLSTPLLMGALLLYQPSIHFPTLLVTLPPSPRSPTNQLSLVSNPPAHPSAYPTNILSSAFCLPSWTYAPDSESGFSAIYRCGIVRLHSNL